MRIQHLVYRTQTVQENELQAAAELDLSAVQLMQRAAQACLQKIQEHLPAPARILILAGPGNNGGDGWVLARLAQQAGYQVQVAAMTAKSDLAKDAAAAWRDNGGKVHALESVDSTTLVSFELVVDALLGTGLSRDLEAPLDILIDNVNRLHAKGEFRTLAIDCPTGLNSDSGQPMPNAIYADWTVTMVAFKPGLVSGKGLNYVGHLSLADLGIGEAFCRSNKPLATVVEQQEVLSQLGPRQPASHKGDHGHVLLVGGAPGYSGAIRVAAQAALRAGAGKVSVLTHPDCVMAITIAHPEVMVHGVDSKELNRHDDLIAQADVIALGPGLAQTNWSQTVFDWVLAQDKPMVMDADGLNLLAKSKTVPSHQQPWWVTPHPGEAARLLMLSVTEIEQDRFANVQKLAEKYSAHALLKGAGTVIAQPALTGVRLVRRGCPALAAAGSGDLLTGIAASMAAQGLAPASVLPVAAWLHAVAAEHAASDGERGTLATDLFGPLRKLVNP